MHDPISIPDFCSYVCSSQVRNVEEKYVVIPEMLPLIYPKRFGKQWTRGDLCTLLKAEVVYPVELNNNDLLCLRATSVSSLLSAHLLEYIRMNSLA